MLHALALQRLSCAILGQLADQQNRLSRESCTKDADATEREREPVAPEPPESGARMINKRCRQAFALHAECREKIDNVPQEATLAMINVHDAKHKAVFRRTADRLSTHACQKRRTASVSMLLEFLPRHC